MFHPPLTLTVNNAAQALEAGLHALAAGQTEFNLKDVSAVDSAAVATMLALQRAARRAGKPLRFVNVPANLLGLVELYGVRELLPISA